jgi:hypothetical protein
MRELRTYNTSTPMAGDRLMPGLAMMIGAVACTILGLMYSQGVLESLPHHYLLPWVIGLGAVFVLPSIILWYKGRFSFADPLIFATWSYFFPAFCLGGIFLAVGWSDPIYINLVRDPETDLPYTALILGLGFAGLAVGYFLPFGKKAGSYLGSKLPEAKVSDISLVIPSLILLSIGAIITVSEFTLGKFGFQRAEEISSYDGILFLTQQFWFQGSFILWLIIFRAERLRLLFVPVIAVLVGSSITKSIFAGNRGMMIQIFALVVLAYILSGRQFRAKQMLIGGGILIVILISGMIFGTTLRMVKGDESQLRAGEYIEKVGQTFEEVGSASSAESLQFGASSLVGRMDIVSTVAVVVSNYELLKPYEDAYGLDNNIINELSTFFIPRVLWPEKPTASDPRRYSDLYFNTGETSFAITPIGDLLRNFGPIGVPIGMLIIGLSIRLFYAALVEEQIPSVWKYSLYIMLLTCISYEGFYGTIIPTLFRFLVTASVGALFVLVIAKRIDRSGFFRQKA